MLDAETVLEPSHPQARPLSVQLSPAHLDGLGDAQAMAVDHQDQRVVANAVAAFLGGLEQPVDLRGTQKVLTALVGVGGWCITLYITPLGRHWRVPRKCLCLRGTNTSTFHTSHEL